MTNDRKTRSSKSRSKKGSSKKSAKKTSAKKTSARRSRKDALQFAPNFTVYTMLPDVVCLYSENRKFFLNGALSCAVVAAIGKGGKGSEDIVRELKRDFPADKIEEALKRLIERRYVVTASAATADAVAGYWASLGLPHEIAEKNLNSYRVSVQSIDVKGAAKLTAALIAMGVRVVTRSPDLTVVLVNDYLESRLAEINMQHVSHDSPWLLVQPSGAFPLVGPAFIPGETACWSCLFDRMIRNREVKNFLEHGAAKAVAVSPLVRNTLGQSGVQLAAVEIAKAIATGFRTELRDHIISLDLSGATTKKHYVARRPQCPTCGSKKLRDPRRAPEPIELSTGAKLVMTSGGYRSMTSRATVERFRKHVSPLSGVVTRLERLESDLPMNTSFSASHNFSAPAESVDQLRMGLIGGISFGKGSTAEQAEASALMEALERYSGVYQGDEIRVMRRFRDFAPGEAILPNEVLLFSDAQSESDGNPPATDPHNIPLDPTRFDQSAMLEWSPVWSLRDHRFKYLPTSTVYFFYRGHYPYSADSNGCAAGNTLEEAIVQGFLELVERDAYAIWWYNRLRLPEVDLNQFDDAYIHDLKNRLAESGRRLWVLDVTSDLGVPTYVAILHWMQNGRENIEFGSGAHFDSRIAMLRSLTELNQFLSIGLMDGGTGEKSTLDGDNPLRLDEHPFLLPSGKAPIQSDNASVALDNTRDQVLACVDIAKRAGLDFLVLDQTRPDIETPVVRVIVPGLRHFYRRFAPGRLYDIPVKLGHLDRPLPEDELTQFLPHT
jgi:ribosomal protein S12 methylthiotransferase accessory factor